MKSNNDMESRAKAMGEKLSLETLEEITGGEVIDDCWKSLVSKCPTADEAFAMLVHDTKEGKIPIGIADLLVGRVESYYEKNGN